MISRICCWSAYVPSVVFIDELDAVGAGQERDATLNQFGWDNIGYDYFSRKLKRLYWETFKSVPVSWYEMLLMQCSFLKEEGMWSL